VRRAAATTDAIVSTATAGGVRERQIKAASEAIRLIAQQLGDDVAMILLWAEFETIAARLEGARSSRDQDANLRLDCGNDWKPRG
jgi:hypothetical protein